MKVILWGLALYFIYQLIFKFVVPVSKVASQMKSKVKEMQEHQEAARHQYEQQQSFQSAPKPPTAKSEDDYIDFEEVK